MKKTNTQWSVTKINRDMQNGIITFDYAYQRQPNAWKKSTKVGLIESCIHDYPIPAVFAETREDSSQVFMIDGQQRFFTFKQFLNNEFTLDDIEENEVEVIENGETKIYDVEGKTFSELPSIIQDMIKETSITVYFLKDATSEQINKIFRNINKGEPFKPFEMFRVEYPEFSDALKPVVEQTEFMLFAFTATQIRNQEHVQSAVQLLAILEDYNDISNKGLSKFAENFGIPNQECIDRLTRIFKYIKESVETIEESTKKKFLKKVHISGIGYIADQAIKNNVSPYDFKQWLVKFFCEENKESTTSYKSACRNSSASKDSVERRKQALQTSYDNFMNKLHQQNEHDSEEE
jgi:hypothetical protein